MAVTVVTHNGSFHADELFATALIKRFISSDIHVIRTRDRDELRSYTNDDSVWVVDVGSSYDEKAKNFDHHQKSFSRHWDDKDRTPFSSCGLVWTYLRDYGYLDCLQSEVIKLIEGWLIRPIDAHDNYHEIWSNARIFKLANRNYNTVENFLRAVSMAEMHLNDLLHSADQHVSNIKLLSNPDVVTFLEDGKIVVFQQEAFNIQGLVHTMTDAMVIVMPKESDKTWSAHSIAVKNHGVTPPQSWLGLNGSELSEVAGLEDMVFVHRGGFLGVAKTCDTAVEIARSMLRNGSQIA